MPHKRATAAYPARPTGPQAPALPQPSLLLCKEFAAPTWVVLQQASQVVSLPLVAGVALAQLGRQAQVGQRRQAGGQGIDDCLWQHARLIAHGSGCTARRSKTDGVKGGKGSESGGSGGGSGGSSRRSRSLITDSQLPANVCQVTGEGSSAEARRARRAGGQARLLVPAQLVEQLGQFYNSTVHQTCAHRAVAARGAEMQATVAPLGPKAGPRPFHGICPLLRFLHVHL